MHRYVQSPFWSAVVAESILFIVSFTSVYQNVDGHELYWSKESFITFIKDAQSHNGDRKKSSGQTQAPVKSWNNRSHGQNLSATSGQA
jgi:hypothetical protein